jgi:hypothetical protein
MKNTRNFLAEIYSRIIIEVLLKSASQVISLELGSRLIVHCVRLL